MATSPRTGELLAPPTSAALSTAAHPALARAGAAALERALTFFTAEIDNPHTRRAYATAVRDFLNWIDERALTLEHLRPPHVAAYRELLRERFSPATVKVRLSAIRVFLDSLTTGGTLPFNPAAAVRPPRYRVHVGSTPAMIRDEAHELLASIAGDEPIDLRDRALIAVMLYSFARISAAVGLRVRDYDDRHRRRFHQMQGAGEAWQRVPLAERVAWLTLHEKGSNVRRVQMHTHASEILEAWLEASGLVDQPEAPIFQGFARGSLSGLALSARQALNRMKVRARAAGLSDSLGNHSCRATGITHFLDAGGTLELAAAIAGHVSPNTTKLYDRRTHTAAAEAVERMRF